MKIASVLARKGSQIATVLPDQTIHDAVVLLAARNIGALIVVDASGHPQGIISERDIVRELARGGNVDTQPISGLMTTKVVYGAPEDDVEAVLRKMTSDHFRHLPIMDEGELAGMVTTADLANAQLSHFKGHADTLEAQLLDQ